MPLIRIWGPSYLWGNGMRGYRFREPGFELIMLTLVAQTDRPTLSLDETIEHR